MTTANGHSHDTDQWRAHIEAELHRLEHRLEGIERMLEQLLRRPSH